MEFAQSLDLYENSRDLLSRLESLEPPSQVSQACQTNGGSTSHRNIVPQPGDVSSDKSSDYLLMNPAKVTSSRDYELMNYTVNNSETDRLSVCSSTYEDSMALMSDDSRFDTIRHVPKHPGKGEQEPGTLRQKQEDKEELIPQVKHTLNITFDGMFFTLLFDRGWG